MKFDTRWYGSERYALKVANRMLRSGKYTRANVRPLRRSPMTGAPRACSGGSTHASRWKPSRSLRDG